MAANNSQVRKEGLFASIGGGAWYAIPAALADSYRKAGADVRKATELPALKDDDEALPSSAIG